MLFGVWNMNEHLRNYTSSLFSLWTTWVTNANVKRPQREICVHSITRTLQYVYCPSFWFLGVKTIYFVPTFSDLVHCTDYKANVGTVGCYSVMCKWKWLHDLFPYNVIDLEWAAGHATYRKCKHFGVNTDPLTTQKLLDNSLLLSKNTDWHSFKSGTTVLSVTILQ